VHSIVVYVKLCCVWQGGSNSAGRALLEPVCKDANAELLSGEAVMHSVVCCLCVSAEEKNCL
jgi:hypothetical protein